MSQIPVPCQQVLERAYSYLRRCGVSELECCRHAQWLAGRMADLLAAGAPTAAQLEALWHEVTRVAEASVMARERPTCLAPEPLRGSIGYARFGRRKRGAR
ncbi:hypothetical protein G3580_06300 [Nitrogeniibacter mangrovi]|uniref:Uncharacterized protein n=1 Tax=Nitrogeniibacter mangrovi TaxID=2016596 RepID=A0A6C1B4S7_9RHOO|nr:hypothetical protein [Nitrogeniibacter mangrovi]QID17290.1 hypothetical protein G3580_06300 [Nitrogeniibacter mangrovi]